jgi:quinohemoprotein ethanol dehydrogenase
MTTLLRAAAVAFVNIGLATAAPSAGNITQERLLAGDREPDSWLTGGRDWRQSYYSPLTDINANNVADLGYAWGYDV